MKKIPCVMMRGGTSRGAFLLAEHLPEDQTQRDKILMAIMGPVTIWKLTVLAAVIR